MTNALPIAQTLLQCFETALNAAPNPPGIVCLRGGTEVIPDRSTSQDECCSGLAWVRIVSTNSADGFSLPGTACVSHMRTTVFELGATRCMPTPGPGELISCDQWTSVVLQMEADHASMETAVCCLINDAGLLGDPTYEVLTYEPVGPDANCVGGTLQIQVTYGCACGSGG